MSESSPRSQWSAGAAHAGVTDDSPEGAAEDALGPIVALSQDRSNLTRLAAVGVFFGAMAILGMAWYIDPSPRGMGTHRQLGLRPCGFLVTTGLPCPTCGMTTAFAHSVRGRVLQALWAQPAGTVMATLTAVLACVAVVVAVTGRRLEINWYRINPMRVLIGGVVLFLGSWTFKIVVVLIAR